MTAFPPPEVIEINLDGTVVGDYSANTPPSLQGLTEGTHTVEAVAIDLAGNRSLPSAPLTFTVDLTPPAPPTWQAAASSAGASTVTVTGTTEALADVSIARAATPEVPVASARADSSGKFTLTGVGTMPGANAFIVTATDAAGNTSTVAGSYFSLATDTSPPEITVNLAHDTGASASDGLTNDPTLTGKVTAASRVSDFKVSVDGSPYVSALGTLSGGRFTLNRSVLESILGRTLPDGPVTVKITATNASGNTSAPAVLNFTLDSARPPTPDPLTLTPGSATGTSPNAFTTNAATLALHTGLAGSTAQVVLFANGVAVTQLTGAEPLTFNVNPADGLVEYVAQAVDAAGNVSFFTAPVDITFDRVMAPPTVTLDGASASAAYGPGRRPRSRGSRSTARPSPARTSCLSARLSSRRLTPWAVSPSRGCRSTRAPIRLTCAPRTPRATPATPCSR